MIQTSFEEEIDEEIKWEVVAVWRVLLIFLGHFVDELQPGELESGDAISLEEIAADLDRVIIRRGERFEIKCARRHTKPT